MAQHVNSKSALWESVSALMVKNYKKENLTRLAKECKIGPGTAARIKEQSTSVGIDILEAIAEHFHLAAWQLLVPGFDPDNPPALQPISKAERVFYEKVMEASKALASEPAPKFEDDK